MPNHSYPPEIMAKIKVVSKRSRLLSTIIFLIILFFSKDIYSGSFAAFLCTIFIGGLAHIVQSRWMGIPTSCGKKRFIGDPLSDIRRGGNGLFSSTHPSNPASIVYDNGLYPSLKWQIHNPLYTNHRN